MKVHSKFPRKSQSFPVVSPPLVRESCHSSYTNKIKFIEHDPYSAISDYTQEIFVAACDIVLFPKAVVDSQINQDQTLIFDIGSLTTVQPNSVCPTSKDTDDLPKERDGVYNLKRCTRKSEDLPLCTSQFHLLPNYGDDKTARVESLKELEDQDRFIRLAHSGLGRGENAVCIVTPFAGGDIISHTASSCSALCTTHRYPLAHRAKSWSSLGESGSSRLPRKNSLHRKPSGESLGGKSSSSEITFIYLSNSIRSKPGYEEGAFPTTVTSDLHLESRLSVCSVRDQEEDTRARQFLLVALDYLCYLAYSKTLCWSRASRRRRRRRCKYTSRHCIVYDYYCAEPVPCLVDSFRRGRRRRHRNSPKLDNPVYFELPPVLLRNKFWKKPLHEIFNKVAATAWNSKVNRVDPNVHREWSFHLGLQLSSTLLQKQGAPQRWRNRQIFHPMKALCNCWKKSDTCIACYMANLEDWNHIHAIAMSAEAQRRLEEDLRFLESINVWHLVNLRSNPHSLYSYGERLEVLSPSQLRAFPQNPYHHHTAYLQDQYLTAAGGNHHHHHDSSISSISATTPLPYPDLIIHASDVASDSVCLPSKFSDANQVGVRKQLKDTTDDYGLYKDVSLVEEEPSPPLRDTGRLKNPSSLYKEPDDYDSEYNQDPNRIASDGKKSVKFSSDTIFVERDMNSPFWRAFAERRRLRRIMKQRKQLNAQIATASYQPSIIEIVKSAFRTKDNNGNVKTKSKGGVLVYDNSSQIPETFTAQYIYTTPRRSRLFRMLTCQCCSVPPC